MKKYILLPLVAACSIMSNAQDFDNKPTITIDNEQEDLHFTVGARMMADAAYYHSDFTPMKSGASITDARIRTSMSYRDWYFYADFGFGGGKFSQKNIFLQYSLNSGDNNHIFKAGYFSDPSTMSRNTSLGSYHFISRAGSAIALGSGRELGLSYKFNNNTFFAQQGVFTEDAYNKQEVGFNGITGSGRWLIRPINDERSTLHFGVNARFAHLGGGETVGLGHVIKKNIALGQNMETYVDGTEQFLGADLPWADNDINFGAEVLYKTDNFFARGEYFHKWVTKKRDSKTLFTESQDNIDAWGSLEAWEAANPLKTNNFNGGYVELGYKLFGNPYRYNNSDALLGGLDGKSLEIVARYNYTNLNDIVDGEYYSAGRDQYYPNGYIEDYPYNSASVGGGKIQTLTLGANYSFNKFAQFMLEYGYNHLNRDKYKYDKNFHTVQARLMFSF